MDGVLRCVRHVDPASSLQIKYCRILCIYFMTMVHMPPGLDAFSAFPFPLFVSKLVTSDILGRASVTALSFISGYLIYHSLQESSWAMLARRRFVNLVMPMAVWNTVLIALGLLFLLVLGMEMQVVRGLRDLPLARILTDRILALNNRGATTSLNFLRDTFACVLLAWPLAWAIRRFSWMVVLALIAIDLTFGFQPIVYRGIILIAFATGIAYAQSLGSLAHISRLRYPALAALLAVAAIETTSHLGYGVDYTFPGYEFLKRLVVSVVMIDVAQLLANSSLPRALIDRIDRSTYFIFLAHNVAFLLFWGAWQLVFGRSLEGPYLVFYLGAPLLWVALAVASAPGIARLPASLQILIQGKAGQSARRATVPRGTAPSAEAGG